MTFFHGNFSLTFFLSRGANKLFFIGERKKIKLYEGTGVGGLSLRVDRQVIGGNRSGVSVNRASIASCASVVVLEYRRACVELVAGDWRAV